MRKRVIMISDLRGSEKIKGSEETTGLIGNN